jgi:hypothetical protein
MVEESAQAKDVLDKKEAVKGVTTLNGKKLYKVLVNGRSCHGGDMEWSLPTQNTDGTWTPGEWHRVEGEISLCNRGLHLTWEPAAWFNQAGCEVYEVEAEELGASEQTDSKVVARACRLLRRVMDAVELLSLCIALTGKCEATIGRWAASGSATVEASGSATVRASGSATVLAYDSATVEAYDSATVEASDSATVRASGSATVLAYDSATVWAKDRCVLHSLSKYNNAKRLVSCQAIHIDRSVTPAVITCAADAVVNRSTE